MHKEKIIKVLWRWPLIVFILFALFWVIFWPILYFVGEYIVAGGVLNAIVDIIDIDLDLPFPISLWLAPEFVPFWFFILAFVFTSKIKDINDFSFVLISGSIVGLIVGLMGGLFMGLMVGLFDCLSCGLGTGVGQTLSFSLAAALAVGLVAGFKVTYFALQNWLAAK